MIYFLFNTRINFYTIFSLYVFPKPGRTRTARRTQRPQRFQPVAAHGAGAQHTAPYEKIQSNFISILFW